MNFYHVSIIEAVKALDPSIEFEITNDDYRALRLDMIDAEKLEQLKAEQNKEYFESRNLMLRILCRDFFETCLFNDEEVEFVHKNIFYPLDIICDKQDSEGLEKMYEYIIEELSKRENKYAIGRSH
jgi:hypothetical protein